MKANSKIIQGTTIRKKATRMKEEITEKTNLEIRHQTNWKRMQEL